MAYNNTLSAGGRNSQADVTRRQAFNGKGLTFIEVTFDTKYLASETTPEAFGSIFDNVTKIINKNGTLLATSYRLAAKATDNDAAELAEVAANEGVDSYEYIVEGTPGQYNAADSAGDVNMDHSATVIAAAEADIETDIDTLSIAGKSTANQYQVKIRTLLPEGVAVGGDDAIHGMFDQRGDV